MPCGLRTHGLYINYTHNLFPDCTRIKAVCDCLAACFLSQIDGEVRDKILCLVEDYARVLPPPEFKESYGALLVRASCACLGL